MSDEKKMEAIKLPDSLNLEKKTEEAKESLGHQEYIPAPITNVQADDYFDKAKEDASDVIELDNEGEISFDDSGDTVQLDNEVEEVQLKTRVDELINNDKITQDTETEVYLEDRVFENWQPVLNYKIRGVYDDHSLDQQVKEIIERSDDTRLLNFLPTRRTAQFIKNLKPLLEKESQEELKTGVPSKQFEVLAELIAATMNQNEKTDLIKILQTDESLELENGIWNDEKGELLNMRGVSMARKGSVIKGKEAILKASASLGTGEPVTIPLPHSGFWITIRSPSEREIVSLYNALASDKVQIGRATSGLTFGALSVKTHNDIYNLFTTLIMNTNLKDVSISDLSNLIKINDLPFIEMGLAKSRYLRGFNFKRMCDNVGEMDENGQFPNACLKVEEKMIDIAELICIDRSKLTDIQIKILGSTGANSITINDYRTYQEQFEIRENKKARLTYKNFTFNLKDPDIETYFVDGLEWIESVIAAYETALMKDNLTEARKEENLGMFINSSVLRNWAHYIESIEFDGYKVEDGESIKEIISNNGSDDEFASTLINGIVDYRNSTIVGVIGIPDYVCPRCQHPNVPTPNTPHLTNVIPLDSLNVFFLMFITKFQMVI